MESFSPVIARSTAADSFRGLAVRHRATEAKRSHDDLLAMFSAHVSAFTPTPSATRRLRLSRKAQPFKPLDRLKRAGKHTDSVN